MRLPSLLAFVVALTAGSAAFAHDYTVGTLHIAHPYARPTVLNQPASAAYLTIKNNGKTADKLVVVSSPIAKGVEIHTMTMEGNVMKMREAGSIELKPAETVSMEPGAGYHLMLMGLRQPLKSGDKFPLTLTFEKAGKAEVTVWVENKGVANAASTPHAH